MKFKRIKKSKDDGIREYYEKHIERFGYTHQVEIITKDNDEGRFIVVQSFQKGVNKEGFNNMVGLTHREMLYFTMRAYIIRIKQIFKFK